MSINKEAVNELYKREGYFPAHFYLVEHEGMNNSEAQDYLNKQFNILIDHRDNQSKFFYSSHPIDFENALPIFYHECCKEMDEFDDYVHTCSTTICQKVKKLFYAR